MKDEELVEDRDGRVSGINVVICFSGELRLSNPEVSRDCFSSIVIGLDSKRDVTCPIDSVDVDIFINGEPTTVDCIEFDTALWH